MASFGSNFGSAAPQKPPADGSNQPNEFVADMPDAAPAESSVFAPEDQAAAQPEPVELLFIDENPFMKPKVRPQGTFGPVPMRTGWDKLLYGTGLAYMAGLSYGGAYGLVRGLQTAQVPNFKVRLNSVLNQSTRYGPWAANSLGVMVMNWAMLDNTLAWYRNGQSDYFNHVSAAFVSGAFFKCTAGLRPAVVSGSILASIVSAYGAVEYILGATSRSSRDALAVTDAHKNASSASASSASATHLLKQQPLPAA